MRSMSKCLLLFALVMFLFPACLGEEPAGLAVSEPANTTVVMDFFQRPLPEIPLPNDIATRYDGDSATGRRINASYVAPTQMERRIRELIGELDGWGVLQPISIPFSDALDINSITAAHRDPNYNFNDDVVYLINVDTDSAEYGRLHHLDVGNGNYPVVLEDMDGYWKNDPRGWTISLLFDEADEDINGNGILDPGEDTDADGVLDRPNYLPGTAPERDDLAGRADALMTFYENETNTLILKPMTPLLERTTYAVVVTRRLLDEDGNSVGSPYRHINHTAQTHALTPLLDVMPDGLALEDVAFAFSYTTQSLSSHWVAVRDGLYGHGVQAHIGETFPPDVSGLEVIRDEGFFPDMTNPHILWTEQWLPAFEIVNQQLQGGDPSSVSYHELMDAARYVDYFVVGRYQSPQLFEREDSEGNWLPLDEQSWPQDLDMIPADTRDETVYFFLSVPRKEISSRGDGEPTPVIFIGHGYTGSRFDLAGFAGYFARYGIATIAIDNVSHGLSVSPSEREAAAFLTESYGLLSFTDAIFTDRAYDQNNDGSIDSGADFWTSYMFHTRDVVRQTALDYMQLVRILRHFDGTRTWDFDVNGDGINELAGDFDGDGVVDIGGDAMLGMTGGSLGGIMSAYMAALEPELTVTVPIVGGGGLADIGIRSQQGGVREAFILRSMGPLYTGTLDEAGEMVIETIVPDLNDTFESIVATASGISTGDTLVVENLDNDEIACGFVSETGTVRAGIESDLGDAHIIRFYRGDALVLGTGECELIEDAEVIAEIDSFHFDVEFQGEMTLEGSPLIALAEGLGLRRANPELRRFQGLGQMVIDPGDPAPFARHMLQEPLYYPGTDQYTGTHSLIISTVGDMSVPVNSGLTLARAAGVLEFLEDNPDHGIPNNQILIDHHVPEGVNTLGRYLDSNGTGIHFDVDNWSDGGDLWPDVPRLENPVRSNLDQIDPLGGVSGFSAFYGNPTGGHGVDLPGGMIDEARENCEATCTEEDCGCETLLTFDVGNFLFGVSGDYMSSGGTDFNPDICHAHWNCDHIPETPATRENPDLQD